jgi:hypothetical protein
MATNDWVFDNGLDAAVSACNAVRLCSQDPGVATYTNANNENDGTPAGYRIGSIAPDLSVVNGTTDGRAIQMDAATGGTVEDTDAVGSGQFWAFLDTVNSRTLFTAPVTGDQPVTDGNSFAISAAFQPCVFRDPT